MTRGHALWTIDPAEKTFLYCTLSSQSSEQTQKFKLSDQLRPALHLFGSSSAGPGRCLLPDSHPEHLVLRRRRRRSVPRLCSPRLSTRPLSHHLVGVPISGDRSAFNNRVGLSELLRITCLLFRRKPTLRSRLPYSGVPSTPKCCSPPLTGEVAGILDSAHHSEVIPSILLSVTQLCLRVCQGRVLSHAPIPAQHFIDLLSIGSKFAILGF